MKIIGLQIIFMKRMIHLKYFQTINYNALIFGKTIGCCIKVKLEILRLKKRCKKNGIYNKEFKKLISNTNKIFR